MGAEQLRDGSQQLGEGLSQAQTGADTLASGLKEGADTIRKIHTGDHAAEMFAAPVYTKESQMTDMPNNGHAMAPYMMSVGLWVGCIAFSLMYPLNSYSGKLRSGKPHDGRAPDYDDWSLNGDILMWNDVLGRAFEISSMGIRVDAESLDRQLKLAGCEERRELPYHQMLLRGQLPLTIGGGIGQSRLCMLMIGCCHIGEIQVSLWDQETMDTCEEAGVHLL